VIVPDFVVERTRFHGLITLLRVKEIGSQPSWRIKVPPARLSAGRKIATATACDRPG
jgi:hypothetical protein